MKIFGKKAFEKFRFQVKQITREVFTFAIFCNYGNQNNIILKTITFLVVILLNHFPVFQLSPNSLHTMLWRPLRLHKKWSSSRRISSVNVTKFAGNCGFGHMYWWNPQWTTSFFAQCKRSLWVFANQTI